MKMNHRIGLIAGSGPFPLVFAQKAKNKGFDVYAIGYHNETDPALAHHVAHFESIHIGQVKRLLNYFKSNGVSEAVMIGAIKKPGSISEIKPDLKAIALIAGMRHNTHDDRILRAFAKALEDEGVKIRPSTFLIPELLAPEGCWTRRRPTKTEQSDINLGWKMAKAIGRLDIGQCVAVQNGTVMAVEAVDGTDATIKRAGRLARGNAVVVKVCKPIQDFRFDVPAVGTQTLRSMKEAGVSVLAIEANRSLVFDREAMVDLADQWKMTIVSMAGPEQ